MNQQFINCPTDKNISTHFQDQLLQLSIRPTNPEDIHQLMLILNSYLSYPDDQLANNHRQANKLGLLDLTSEERVKLAENTELDPDFQWNIRETKILKLHSQTCRCCGFLIQPTNIATCQAQIHNIKNLGTSTRIFFASFANIALLLATTTIIYSIFAFTTNITTAYSGNYLNSNHQSLDYLSISLAAKSRYSMSPNSNGANFYQISSWLGVAMLAVWWLWFAKFKKEIVEMESSERRKLGVSDFSIVIENMPTDFTRQQIEAQFNTYLKRMKEEYDETMTLSQIKIVKYNEGKPFYLNESEFNDEELVDIHKRFTQARQNIASYVIEYQQYGRFVSELQERRHNYAKFQQFVHKKKVKYEQIVTKMRAKLNSRQQVTRTVVFVTFLTHQMRHFILYHNENSLFARIKRLVQCWKTSDYFQPQRNGISYNDIKIDYAPEPEDIHWGNLGLTTQQKFMRVSFTALATLVMIGISFAIVYGLSTVQNQQQRNRYISILISLAISFSNLLIIKVIQYMTSVEKDYTMNNFQISITIKSVIAQLVNSILVPLIVNFYIKHQNIFGESGLVEDIFILAISNSFIPPLVKLIDPYNIFLQLRYKYYHHETRRLYLSQFQLNEISEKMEYEIGMEYIYLISNFLFISFFVSLQPVIALFGLLSLFFMYWIQKYSLFNRCQRPVPGPDVITSTMYQMIYFGPIAFALGNLTWSWFLPDQSFRDAVLPNLIALGIGLLMFILPYDLCMRSPIKKQNKNYLEKRIYFPSEYDRLNPSTSKQAIQQYRAFLNQKKRQFQQSSDQSLNDEVYQGLIEASNNNIYKGNLMNRFTQNYEDFVIQQIFQNQSRNAVNPLQLLSALIPQDQNKSQLLHAGRRIHSQNFPFTRSTRVNIGPSMKAMYQEPSSKDLVERQPSPTNPNINNEDYMNIYNSNIKFDDILAVESKIKSSQQLHQRKNTRKTK